MVEVIQHPSLREALDAARTEAQEQPLVKSKRGGPPERDRRRGEDPPEPWYFVPDVEFFGRARYLLDRHSLALEWLESVMGERGQVMTTWRLRLRLKSVPSLDGSFMITPQAGPEEIFRYQAPVMPLETPTHGVLGTTNHAKRAVHDLVLQIPQVDRAEANPVLTTPKISQETFRPAIPVTGERERGECCDVDNFRAAREMDETVGPMPPWSDPHGPGGLADPGLLGGEDEPCTGLTARWCPVHGECTCGGDRATTCQPYQMYDADCPLHGAQSDHAPDADIAPAQTGEAERDEMAPEADAAARGEVVDGDALRAALNRRGKRLGLPIAEWMTSALQAAHADVDGVDGVDWSQVAGPRLLAHRPRLVAYLQETGDLP
jgi:hypothetical protein